MSWILFSILAALCWAIVNTIDKYILTKWIRNPLVPVIILIITGFIAAVAVYFVYGFSPLSYFNIFLALTAGIFYVLIAIFYFKALKIEEVSRVIPLFFLSTLLIAIFAAIFLGELFTPLKYLGIILLVVGAVLISLKKFTKITLGKSFWWMILCVTASSATGLLTKYLLNFADFWTIFAWERVGAIIALVPVAYVYLPELIDTVKMHGKRVVAVMSANAILNLVGVLFSTIALSIGYVTLVRALSSVQPFFVLLFAVILSVFYPKILKEEIDKKTVLIKLIAITLMFVGVILII